MTISTAITITMAIIVSEVISKRIIFACIVHDNNSCSGFWGRYLFMVYKFLIITLYNLMWYVTEICPVTLTVFQVSNSYRWFKPAKRKQNSVINNIFHLLLWTRCNYVSAVIRYATTVPWRGLFVSSCSRHYMNAVDDCYLLLPRTEYCQQAK
jgi:hypothetical protein